MRSDSRQQNRKIGRDRADSSKLIRPGGADDESDRRGVALLPLDRAHRDRFVQRSVVDLQILKIASTRIARFADDDHALSFIGEERSKAVFAEVGIDGDAIESPFIEKRGCVRGGRGTDISDLAVEQHRDAVRHRVTRCQQRFQTGDAVGRVEGKIRLVTTGDVGSSVDDGAVEGGDAFAGGKMGQTLGDTVEIRIEPNTHQTVSPDRGRSNLFGERRHHLHFSFHVARQSLPPHPPDSLGNANARGKLPSFVTGKTRPAWYTRRRARVKTRPVPDPVARPFAPSAPSIHGSSVFRVNPLVFDRDSGIVVP